LEAKLIGAFPMGERHSVSVAVKTLTSLMVSSAQMSSAEYVAIPVLAGGRGEK
jgi:hypothetical protein